MFSPSQSNPASTARQTRRRPLSNSNNTAQPKAKRQRLTDETFMPPDAPEMEEVKSHRTSASRNEIFAPAPQQEVAVRPKKSRTGDRVNKGDGSIILTTNDTYTVSKLVALPDRLKTDPTVRQHGAIYSDTGYALTLTHTHAIAWPYTANIPSPEAFEFPLPEPSKRLDGPLPLGSLVSASASSSDPGLVVVMPISGKITFWESISSASTLDLKIQRTGVELYIPGLLSGESIIQLLNAESAGFVLAFSTGRTAYMSVRDGQGRPAISVQFLRGSIGPTNAGIFGSLRNVLSGSSWQGDIAAIRAGRPDKVGERNVTIASSKGKIQSWDIHRGGHTSMIAEAEGREKIVMAVKRTVPSLSSLLIESFEIHDFTYISKLSTEKQRGNRQDTGIRLLLLISLAERQDTHYFLVEVHLAYDNLEIRNLQPIKSYTTPVNRTASSKPRLYLPDPGLIGFVVFDRAIIVVSLANQLEGPEFQLQAESHGHLNAFEDVIDFRKDRNVEIVGSGIEEPQGPSHGIEDSKSHRYKAKHPAVVIQVRGGGVLRISTTDTAKSPSGNLQPVTAMSKLEQAIFFGTLDNNPLSFTVRPEASFTAEEIGMAALELSTKILKSETKHIRDVPASIEQNLRKRASALYGLAEYLKATGVVLDRVTRWKLLWDAEKMAAALLIWKHYDAYIREKPAGQKRGVITEVVEWIHDEYKSEPLPESGELDRVRHWFIKDIWNLEYALPWTFQVMKYAVQDGQKDNSSVLGLLSEANDFVLNALQGAFEFRTANLRLYGLGNEDLEHGILNTGYEGLPEFWTSTMFVAENLRKQAEFAGELIQRGLDDPSVQSSPVSALVYKLRDEQSALIDIAILSNNERMRWDMAQDDALLQIEAGAIESLQIAAQEKRIIQLAGDFGLIDQAIDLAEKHKILPTLACVLQFELARSSSRALSRSGENSEELDVYYTRANNIRNRIRNCFTRFGHDWATALYEFEISEGAIGDLLDGWPEQQEYLTSFLRSAPRYGKLCWINDIVKEENFDHASETLLDLGLHQEEHLWSKKIELSLGKLALLAGRNYSQTNGLLLPVGGKMELDLAKNQLGLIKIQESAYTHILPYIQSAIDQNAELQLALETSGNKVLARQQFLASYFEESMSKLIKQESMSAYQLIDLLTLMRSDEPDEFAGDQETPQESFRAQMFYLALRAISYGVHKDDQVLAQRIIWRRCMLSDHWADVNNTEMKDDREVSDQLRGTALYLTLRACFANGLFDKDSLVKPISPENALGAGIRELEQRFSALDPDLRERVKSDMQVEDDALAPAIKQCRLEHWFQAALELAREDFEAALAHDMEDGPVMGLAEAKLQEAENIIKEKEQKKSEGFLLVKPRYKSKANINSSLGNFRSSIMQY